MERPIEENYTFYKDRGVNVSSRVTEGLCEVIYLTSSMKMMSLTSSHISSAAFFTPIKKHKKQQISNSASYSFEKSLELINLSGTADV